MQQSLSAYYLVLEIQQTYRGMMVAIPAPHWKIFETLSVREFAAVLAELANHVSLHRYRKTQRGPKKPPPQKNRYKNGEHIATAKVIADRKKR